MASPASITSGSNALWQQGQSQQAQRAADQASQAAQSLQAQARDARAVADRAQDEARSLEMKAGQAQSAAAQASLSIQASASFQNMQTSSSDIYTVLPKAVSLDNKIPAQIAKTTVSTTSTAQNVGTMINTTA
jgi:hypothetical protein